MPQDPSNPHTVSGLIRKRAEIAGQIEHAQATLRQLIIDLDNLDHTIRIFDPDIDLVEIKPKPLPPRHQAYMGELTRIVLSALRNSERPLTTAEIAQHVPEEHEEVFVNVYASTKTIVKVSYPTDLGVIVTFGHRLRETVDKSPADRPREWTMNHSMLPYQPITLEWRKIPIPASSADVQPPT